MGSSSPNRAKLSTTVARENFQYLEAIVRSGKAENLAQALDRILHRSRRAENRQRLERATTAYFDGLSGEPQAEEDALTQALARGTEGIDFDRE
jgi:hypothetical protein